MKALFLAFSALWICSGVGRILLGRLAIWSGNASLERFAYSAALGLGIAAYGVLALGLCGLLSFWPITLWWLLLAGCSVSGMRSNAIDAAACVRSAKFWKRSHNLEHWLCLVGLVVICICGIIALLACFLPPMGREWDAISYHLADPKVFLQMGRVVSLPTEHHSNFPFTLEMLFAVGLLYDGYPLANLFHFLTAALTVLLIFGFCSRNWSALTGVFAAILYATTPSVLWQAGVAYIDLAFGMYSAMATFAVVRAFSPPDVESQSRELHRKHWLLLAGTMMGLGLGVKYLALLPFGLILVYLVVRRLSFRLVLVYTCAAVAIAFPWYAKNIVLTRNPVYPYFYSRFPGSKYWSADRAATYQSEQGSFGYASSLKEPRDAVLNLIQSPWRLVSDADRYANKGDYTFTTLMGGSFAALCFALLFFRRVPSEIRDIYILGVLQVVAWFFVAQVGRYLLSIVPLLSVVGGYTLGGVYHRQTQRGLAKNPGNLFENAARWAAIFLVFGQCTILLWGVFALPSGGREAVERNMLPTGLSVPEAVSDLLRPGGREESLRRRLDVYAASEWINQNTPKEAGVVLYDETRGFYIDRPYLWGNAAHSSYIPYDIMKGGRELSEWLHLNRVKYALINLNWSPQRMQDKEMPYGPAGNEEVAMQRWFYEAEQTEPFRKLIQDALRNGTWRTVFAQNGVVVLEVL